MGESENVEILKRMYAAFKEGDIPGLLQMYASDAEWEYPAIKDIHYAGPRRGREEIRRFFDTLAEVEEPVDFRQNEFLSQGDRVVVLGTYRARAKSTGRVWESRFVHAATIRNGKIQRFEIYFNTVEAAEAHRK